MDLLDKNNALDLNDPAWKIYTEDVTALPQYIGADAVVDALLSHKAALSTVKLKILSCLQEQKLPKEHRL